VHQVLKQVGIENKTFQALEPMLWISNPAEIFSVSLYIGFFGKKLSYDSCCIDGSAM
jgi:hypothetical protein